MNIHCGRSHWSERVLDLIQWWRNRWLHMARVHKGNERLRGILRIQVFITWPAQMGHTWPNSALFYRLPISSTHVHGTVPAHRARWHSGHLSTMHAHPSDWTQHQNHHSLDPEPRWHTRKRNSWQRSQESSSGGRRRPEILPSPRLQRKGRYLLQIGQNPNSKGCKESNTGTMEQNSYNFVQL